MRKKCGTLHRSKSRSRRSQGFTLVELLIVIAVIGILSSLALKAIAIVQENTAIALTRQLIGQTQIAVERYYQDEGMYPAQDQSSNPDDNHFKWAYTALLEDRSPDGKGGRNAPYLSIKEDQIVVWDEEVGAYRKAKRSERNDPHVEKLVTDAWGEALIYRCNKGDRRQDWMHNRASFDLYSKGVDGEDQTKVGLEEENDDIGNW